MYRFDYDSNMNELIIEHLISVQDCRIQVDLYFQSQLLCQTGLCTHCILAPFFLGWSTPNRTLGDHTLNPSSESPVLLPRLRLQSHLYRGYSQKKANSSSLAGNQGRGRAQLRLNFRLTRSLRACSLSVEKELGLCTPPCLHYHMPSMLSLLEEREKGHRERQGFGGEILFLLPPSRTEDIHSCHA